MGLVVLVVSGLWRADGEGVLGVPIEGSRPHCLCWAWR